MLAWRKNGSTNQPFNTMMKHRFINSSKDFLQNRIFICQTILQSDDRDSYVFTFSLALSSPSLKRDCLKILFVSFSKFSMHAIWFLAVVKTASACLYIQIYTLSKRMQQWFGEQKTYCYMRRCITLAKKYRLLFLVWLVQCASSPLWTWPL